MIELWIPITIAGAFFQNVRSALQKHLKKRLSNSGAAYARFLYALPFSLLYLWGVSTFGDYDLPTPNSRFFLFCLLGGVFQILFTTFLLWMFSFRSFAVGTTFSKLEVVVVALIGAIILGDTLNAFAIAAISISVAGVVALSLGQEKISVSSLLAGLQAKPTIIGLFSAVWVGTSVVFFRGASLSLGTNNFFMAAAFTLAVSLVIQTIIMGVYLVYREPGEFGRVIKQWRWASAVGVAGILASICWFTAFTIQNAGYVRAVGQIELIFTFMITTLVFRERVGNIEIVGIVLISLSILLIVLAG